jgi:biotin operon repressor
MRRKEETETKEYLFSRICIDAAICSSMARVKELLKPYPNMRLERDGTSLRYLLERNDACDHFFSLEFEKRSIAITVYSKRTPALFIQEAMLRLLGVIQTLSGCYRVELESLYPYLVMVIAAQQLDSALPQKTQECNPLPDVILSKRLIKLINENSKLREEQESLTKNFRRMVLKAVVLSSVSEHSVDSIAAKLGIAKKDVVAALDSAESVGYRVVSTGRGTFNLVRL